MRLVYASRKGEQWDISDFVVALEWTGDYQQGARTLTAKLLYSDLDTMLPTQTIGKIDMGERLFLYTPDGTEIFRGYIFTIDRAGHESSRTVKAYDSLIYVMKAEVAAKFKKKTPEDITKQVCASIGVKPGTLAASGGKKQTFAHIGKSGYDAIMAAYTKVSSPSKKYMVRMRGDKLEVVQKGAYLCARELRSDADITDASYTSSIEDAVTIVRAVTSSGKKVEEFKNEKNLTAYGRLQRVYEKDKNAKSSWKNEAKDLLAGPEHTVSVSIIGGADAFDLLTGNAVQVYDAGTGLKGKFYIDSDTHTFQDGQHSVQLNLRFDNRMDEKET